MNALKRFGAAVQATFDSSTKVALHEFRLQLAAAIFFFIAGFVSAVFALYQIGRDEREEEIRSFVAGVVSAQLLLIFLLICLFIFVVAFSIRLVERVPEDEISNSQLVSTRMLHTGLGGVSAFILPAIGFFLGLAAFQAVMLVDAYIRSCPSGRIVAGLQTATYASGVLIAAYVALVVLRSVQFRNRIVCFSLLVLAAFLFSLSVLDLVGDLPSTFETKTVVVRDPLTRIFGMSRCEKYKLWRL